MSDFTSNFWSVYIAGITILSVVACLVLLWISGQTKAQHQNGVDQDRRNSPTFGQISVCLHA